GCYIYEVVVIEVFFFFFFQAEDGIRDRTVTGVQTCALPISMEHEFPVDLLEPLLFVLGRLLGDVCARLEEHALAAIELRLRLQRSEERRVGKECRSRWWRDHKTTNERIQREIAALVRIVREV